MRLLPAAVFLALSAAGVALFLAQPFGGKGWEVWSALDSASAVAIAVLVFMGYLAYIRAEEYVGIYLKNGDTLYDTGLGVLRKDCTRSEVLGILGMIQKDGVSRYNIAYLKKPEFLRMLYDVQRARRDKVVIELKDEEMKQFDPRVFQKVESGEVS